MSIFEKNAFSNFFGLNGESTQVFNSFGSMLKTIRKGRNLTTSELAEKSEISQSYISQLENNVRYPSDSIIEKLAYALAGYDYSQLGENDKNTNHFSFSSETDKQRFFKMVTYLKDARDYMKIQEIYPDVSMRKRPDGDPLSKEEKQLLKNFSKLSNEQKQQLISYLNFLLNS